MRRFSTALLIPLLLTGCPREKEEPLTFEEAETATQEAALASKAENLSSSVVEISTNFTIGGAVKNAAAELRDFIQSQLPCAGITLENATLTVEFGANDGNCTYRGHEFSGTAEITVSKNEEDQVIVNHEWTDLSNGEVEMNGTAEVTWDFENKTRHVVHETHWLDLDTGREAEGSGDRVQSVLPGGLTEGIEVNGSRSWTGESGTWDLGIDGVELRWVDPVPQAGSYTLGTPFDKSLSLSFNRVDDDTIKVTVTGPKRSFHFNVTRAGGVDSAD
jgi:hypothetical protein